MPAADDRELESNMAWHVKPLPLCHFIARHITVTSHRADYLTSALTYDSRALLPCNRHLKVNDCDSAIASFPNNLCRTP